MKFILTLLVCLSASAADMSIAQENGHVRITVRNNEYSCAALDWSNTLRSNDWHWYGSLRGQDPFSGFSFVVKTNQQRMFWRLRDCAMP